MRNFALSSSYLWRIKHNIMHHTYANIANADDDINVGPLARLSPSQARHRFHRLQHYYLWGVYGLLLLNWHLIYDFKNLARSRIAKNRIARPRGWALAELVAGKGVFIAWAFVLPMFFHPWWMVLLTYIATVMLIGLLLGIVFQLAHCVEEATFPVPPQEGRMQSSWAEHQLQTTVDFAPSNRLLSWYVGGLNFQIEHHLFPQICHIHYPQIATIVRAVCVERGLHYAVNDTFLGALASHGRWIRRMGLVGLARS